MAAKTTVAAGYWDVAANWNAGTLPAPTDTVTLTHAIQVRDSRTIGHSPGASDGTAAIAIGTNGSLIINPTGTVICRGDFSASASNTVRSLDIQAGGKFYFDASIASNPATSAYRGILPDQSPGSQPTVRIQGTPSARCVVSSVTTNSAANGRFVGSGTNDYGLIEAYFTDFSNLGSGSNFSFVPYLAGAAAAFIIEDCTFTNCGGISHTNHVGADCIFRILRTKFTGTLTTNPLQYSSYGAIGTGERRLERVSFDKVCQLYAPRDLTLNDVYFHEGYTTTNADAAIQMRGGSGIFMRQSTNDINLNGDLTDAFMLFDSTASNPHNVAPAVQNGTGRTWKIHDSVFQYIGTAGDGDYIVPGAPAAAQTLEVYRSIFLPNGDRSGASTPVSLLGGANLTVKYRYNTAFVGGQGFAIGETYAGHTGFLAEFDSNIFWNDTVGGYKIQDSGTDDEVIDIVSALAADYNCGWNVSEGGGKGYGSAPGNLEFSSGVPGAHDVDQNPQFVDDTRKIEKWDLSLGGTGTVGGALTRIQNDPSLTRTSLLPYIRNGFIVQNTAVRTGSKDGTVIGAVQTAPSGGVVTPPVDTNPPTSTGNVPLKAEYQSIISEFALYESALLADGGQTLDYRLANAYYDAIANAYRLKDSDGNAQWDTFAARAVAIYRDYYVNTVSITPAPGSVAGYMNFTTGLVEHFLRTGDVASKTAALNILANGAYVSSGDAQGHEYSRECAYALISHIQVTRMPGVALTSAQLARRQVLFEWCLGHIDQWVNSLAQGSSIPIYCRPFMAGLTARALIMYWDYVGKDPRILSKLSTLADYLWTNGYKLNAGAWGAAKAFLYTIGNMTGNPHADPSLDTYTQPDLNMLIAPLYGWLWKETGTQKWRDRGDSIWTGGVAVYSGAVYVSGAYLGGRSAALVNGKHVNQQLYWAPDYITWAQSTPGVGPGPGVDPNPSTAELEAIPAQFKSQNNFAGARAAKVIPRPVTIEDTDTYETIYTPSADSYAAIVGWVYADPAVHTLTFATEAQGQDVVICELERSADSETIERLAEEPIFIGNKGKPIKVKSSVALNQMLFYVIEIKFYTFN